MISLFIKLDFFSSTKNALLAGFMTFLFNYIVFLDFSLGTKPLAPSSLPEVFTSFAISFSTNDDDNDDTS